MSLAAARAATTFRFLPPLGKREEKMEEKPPSAEQSKGDTLQVHAPSQPSEGQHSSQVVATTYTIIGWVLQVGVILSAAIIVIGLFLEFLQPNKFTPQKLQSFPETFGQVLTGLLVLRPVGSNGSVYPN